MEQEIHSFIVNGDNWGLKDYLEANKKPLSLVKNYARGLYKDRSFNPSINMSLDGMKQTFLTTALECGNFEAVEILLNCGVFKFQEDPKVRNYFVSLLKYDVERMGNRGGVQKTFQLIQDRKLSPLYYPGKPDVQPIHEAIRKENWFMMKLIANADPRTVNSYNRAGETPIQMLAYRYSNPELLDFLIQHGANTEPNECGYIESALSLSIEGHHIENVRYLLEHGCDPNSTRGFYLTALHTLCISYKHGDDKILDEILPRITDINVGSYTPLHCAFRRANMELIERLIKNGADPYREDNHGHNSVFEGFLHGPDFIDQMYRKGFLDFSYRNSSGKDYITLILGDRRWAAKGVLKMICFAAEHGMDFTGKDKEGKTIIDHLPRNPKGILLSGFKPVEDLLKRIIKDQEGEKEDTFSDIGF